MECDGSIQKFESESKQMSKRLQSGFKEAKAIKINLENAFSEAIENSKVQLGNTELSPEIRFLYLSHLSLLNEEYSKLLNTVN